MKIKEIYNTFAINWQILAQIATTLAFILATITFIIEIKANRDEREYSILVKYIDTYGSLSKESNEAWSGIKGVVRNNPNTKKEISDKTSTLEYLKTRFDQKEPLYDIERYILENEIQRLSLLNEICRLSIQDENKSVLTKALLSREISFYQNKLQDILVLYNKASQFWLMSRPRYDMLMKFKVEDFFGEK